MLSSRDVNRAQGAFISGMAEGYANNAKPEKVPELPGAKRLITLVDEFRLVDTWHTTPDSRKSIGTTLLYRGEILWWTMNYGGWYEPEAIPFLRKCLKKAYFAGLFFGGRGPWSAVEEGLVYVNAPSAGSTFLKFDGEESIVVPDKGITLGTHWYRGEMML